MGLLNNHELIILTIMAVALVVFVIRSVWNELADYVAYRRRARDRTNSVWEEATKAYIPAIPADIDDVGCEYDPEPDEPGPNCDPEYCSCHDQSAAEDWYETPKAGTKEVVVFPDPYRWHADPALGSHESLDEAVQRLAAWESRFYDYRDKYDPESCALWPCPISFDLYTAMTEVHSCVPVAEAEAHPMPTETIRAVGHAYKLKQDRKKGNDKNDAVACDLRKACAKPIPEAHSDPTKIYEVLEERAYNYRQYLVDVRNALRGGFSVLETLRRIEETVNEFDNCYPDED
jgi:hypothetical protein